MNRDKFNRMINKVSAYTTGQFFGGGPGQFGPLEKPGIDEEGGQILGIKPNVLTVNAFDGGFGGSPKDYIVEEGYRRNPFGGGAMPGSRAYPLTFKLERGENNVQPVSLAARFTRCLPSSDDILEGTWTREDWAISYDPSGQDMYEHGWHGGQMINDLTQFNPDILRWGPSESGSKTIYLWFHCDDDQWWAEDTNVEWAGFRIFNKEGMSYDPSAPTGPSLEPDVMLIKPDGQPWGEGSSAMPCMNPDNTYSTTSPDCYLGVRNTLKCRSYESYVDPGTA